MSNELAHSFDPVLMRYTPVLFCFEVKPNSVYPKTDYISLLVKASHTQRLRGGNEQRIEEAPRKGPDRRDRVVVPQDHRWYELQSAISAVFEEQADELKKKKGLLNRPVPVAFDWHDQLFYAEKA
jgi:hypothetical protein